MLTIGEGKLSRILVAMGEGRGVCNERKNAGRTKTLYHPLFPDIERKAIMTHGGVWGVWELELFTVMQCKNRFRQDGRNDEQQRARVRVCY